MDDLLTHNIPDADSLALFIVEAQMPDDMRLRFKEAYKTDPTYYKIINDLRAPLNGALKLIFDTANLSGRNKRLAFEDDIVTVAKPGYAFRLVDSLLYNCNNNGTKRLIVLKVII